MTTMVNKHDKNTTEKRATNNQILISFATGKTGRKELYELK